MLMNLFDYMGPLTRGFTEPRTIRTIKDGKAVDSRTARDLNNLPERTLRDIGFTSC